MPFQNLPPPLISLTGERWPNPDLTRNGATSGLGVNQAQPTKILRSTPKIPLDLSITVGFTVEMDDVDRY